MTNKEASNMKKCKPTRLKIYKVLRNQFQKKVMIDGKMRKKEGEIKNRKNKIIMRDFQLNMLSIT